MLLHGHNFSLLYYVFALINIWIRERSRMVQMQGGNLLIILV